MCNSVWFSATTKLLTGTCYISFNALNAVAINTYKSSAAAEMGNCGHNRHGPKTGAL